MTREHTRENASRLGDRISTTFDLVLDSTDDKRLVWVQGHLLIRGNASRNAGKTLVSGGMMASLGLLVEGRLRGDQFVDVAARQWSRWRAPERANSVREAFNDNVIRTGTDLTPQHEWLHSRLERQTNMFRLTVEAADCAIICDEDIVRVSESGFERLVQEQIFGVKCRIGDSNEVRTTSAESVTLEVVWEERQLSGDADPCVQLICRNIPKSITSIPYRLLNDVFEKNVTIESAGMDDVPVKDGRLILSRCPLAEKDAVKKLVEKSLISALSAESVHEVITPEDLVPERENWWSRKSIF